MCIATSISLDGVVKYFFDNWAFAVTKLLDIWAGRYMTKYIAAVLYQYLDHPKHLGQWFQFFLGAVVLQLSFIVGGAFSF